MKPLAPVIKIFDRIENPQVDSCDAVKFGCVFPRKLSLDLIGNAAKLLFDYLSRARPCRTAVRIITRPHVVVDHFENIGAQDADAVLLKGDVDLASYKFARQRGNGR